MEEFSYSERLACKLVAVDRSNYRYGPRAGRNGEMREAWISLARQRPRYGYRRLWVVLSCPSHDVSIKRVYRL
jgi:putative transposase